MNAPVSMQIDNTEFVSDESIKPGPNNLPYWRMIARLTASGWTAASLSVQGSNDGTNWYPIYDNDKVGGAGYVGGATPSHLYSMVFRVPACFTQYRLWSHNGSGTDVAQGGNRAFTVYVEQSL